MSNLEEHEREQAAITAAYEADAKRFDVHAFDPDSWFECIWAALEELPEGSLTDEQRDNVATAMAWAREAVDHDGR